jgi:hypothetical protein
LNVHPATFAHGVVKGANQRLQHQTVLPTIASAISLIFTGCPRMLVDTSSPACAAPKQEFRSYDTGLRFSFACYARTDGFSVICCH